jgi:hypothetical protein
MNNSTNNANSGRPAGAGAPTATSFNALPMLPLQQRTPNSVNPSSSRSSSSRGSGRYPSRTSYAPRRRPQEPQLPKTLVGDRIQPNSEAELSAHVKAMAEFEKEMATYNEAIEAGRSRGNCGLKCSNQGQNSGNGNNSYNPNISGLNSNSNPNNYAQHRELARSLGSQPPNSTSANPNGNANQNSVLQTTNRTLAHQATHQAHQAHPPRELDDKFLFEFNSSNHLAQLDQIRALDREQGRRGTSNERCVEIAGFLRRIKVEDPMEAPVAKKQLLDKNGKPIFEVLSLCSSKDKQLALTHENSTKICMAATEYTAELGSTGMDPEWNWASWSNYRGRIAVASEEQAKLVTALFNSLVVEGVGPFRVWRAHEVVELTSVKLTLSKGYLYTWTADKIISGILLKNNVEVTYSEPTANHLPTHQHHVVHFKADPKLRANLARHQTTSATFYLKLAGQEREIYMARDPLVVAAEAAAGLKLRIETALAKAIRAYVEGQRGGDRVHQGA